MEKKINTYKTIRYIIMHLLPLGAVFTGVALTDWWWLLGLLFGRLFFVTAGHHRYFSHKAYSLNRFWQFVLAFLTQTTVQKGVIWWAAHHRHHHRFSDQDNDLHSPKHGFWWSHVGWILSDESEEVSYEGMEDLTKYPELVWLDKHPFLAPAILGVATLILGGPSALFFGFFLSNILLWHLTYTINSIVHIFGRRRFATDDSSRNSFIFGLLLLGEGWHNNHHFYQASARQGFYWWEIDITYYILQLGYVVGIVKKMKHPPVELTKHRRVKDGYLDTGMLKIYLHKGKDLISRMDRKDDGNEKNWHKDIMNRLSQLTDEIEQYKKKYKKR